MDIIRSARPGILGYAQRCEQFIPGVGFNILPDRVLFNPLKLLAHRSVEEVVNLIAMGERATWPKIEMIRVQTKIGHTLDEIVQRYDHGPLQADDARVRRAG